MNKGLKIVLMLVVIGIAVWGFGKWQQADRKEYSKNGGATYKIGAILALTGDGAAYGEPAKNTMLLALDEINSKGGVNGKKLELIFEDDKCNGKDAANATQKLVNVDKVKAIIGSVCSGATISSVPIAAAQKVAMFSHAASSPLLTNISPFFFRNYPSDSTQGKVLADISFNTKKWKKIAFVHEETDYALGINKAFTESFEGFGGKVVTEKFPTTTVDFRTQLTKLRSEKPDALFVDTQTPAVAERVLKQLQDMGWKPKILVNDVIIGTPDLLKKFKPLLEGGLGAEFGIDESNPKFKALIANYKTKYNAELPYQSYGQCEYDSVYMIADAIKQVGYDGEKIAQWSRTVKDWDGASGKVSILESGDRAGGHRPEMIKNGKVVPFSE